MKHELEISVAGHDVIPAQTGEVFGNHTVDFSIPPTSLKEKVKGYTTYKVKIYFIDFIRFGIYTKSYRCTMEEYK